MKASTLFRTGSSSPDSATAPNLVVMHLSGSRRGTTEKLAGERLRIGTAANAEITSPSTASRPFLLTMPRCTERVLITEFKPNQSKPSGSTANR